MSHRIAIAGLVLTIASAFASPANARPRDIKSLAMMEGVAVDPPRGYAVMCEQDLDLCSALAKTGGDEDLASDLRLKLLRQVDRYVNQHVRQASDEETVGEPDVWRRPGVGHAAAGDCEDLAIEKRLRLIAAGFPAKDLYFAVGLARGFGMHAVLVARTERGDLVLDSLSPAIRLWSDTPYIWVSRQAPGQPDRWESAMALLPGAPPLQMASATPRSAPVASTSDSSANGDWERVTAPLADDAEIRLASLTMATDDITSLGRSCNGTLDCRYIAGDAIKPHITLAAAFDADRVPAFTPASATGISLGQVAWSGNISSRPRPQLGWAL